MWVVVGGVVVCGSVVCGAVWVVWLCVVVCGGVWWLVFGGA